VNRDPAIRAASILVAILWAVAATAGERVHEVRPGESASSIAKRYYGDYELAPLLLEYNGRTGNVIRVGEKLRVPFCEVHRVGAGDTWSGLADRYLGRGSAYRAVAALNGLEPARPLGLGIEIVFPVPMEYRLQRGDTLAGIAERFYGDVELRDALQGYNDIEDPRRLAVGQTIEIPLMSLELREIPVEPAPAKPPPVPESKPEPQPVARFSEPLDATLRAFVDGDYETAREWLESLREPVTDEGTLADRVRFWRLLAFVHVAFDDESGACVAYRSLTELSPGSELAPDLVSPKIRDSLSRCGSTGDASPRS
jgi:LysM repeat protein